MTSMPAHSILLRTALAALLGLCSLAASGMDATEGMVDEPCPPPLAMPPEGAKLLSELFFEPHPLQPAEMARLGQNEQFAAFQKESRRRGAADWAGLCRFHHSNVAMMKAATRTRVVFMGDSITENWGLADPGFFAAGVVNRGISAQTSAQMLLRFRADVIALRPAAVHILAGTNDVAGNNGPTSPQDFQNNIQSMAELAKASGIRVILGSIPPAAAFSWRPAMRPVPRIRALNDWMRKYAASNGHGYVDYYAALVGPAGELRANLANEGVHPNRDGYVIMRRLAEAAMAAQPTP
ncbi:MAG: GDSL-type esterase/lipase family protein [Steroidobacteraceae bacterium]